MRADRVSKKISKYSDFEQLVLFFYASQYLSDGKEFIKACERFTQKYKPRSMMENSRFPNVLSPEVYQALMVTSKMLQPTLYWGMEN